MLLAYDRAVRSDVHSTHNSFGLRIESYMTTSDQPRGTSASARTGLPVPPVSFSGATTSSAPVGGSEAWFASCVTPYFPAPRR